MKYNKSVFLILLSLVLIFSSCSKKNNSSSDFSDIKENKLEFFIKKIPLGKDKIEFECRVYDENKIFLPLENYCLTYKIKYEVCARCGHTKVFLPKLKVENSPNFCDENQSEFDVLQVEWNSPYVSYANKTERKVLSFKTFYENSVTWVSLEILNFLIEDLEF